MKVKRYRLSLIKLFEQVHRIQANPGDSLDECLNIQETLIKKITYIEYRIKKLKLYIRRLKWELGNKESERLNKENAQNSKNRIRVYQYDIDQYQELIYIFKLVGDALAFCYINKWDIKPLSLKRPPGFISGKKGSRLERNILRKVMAMGYVALLNDLTNCLRYGDITVPVDGKFVIFEAKSGKGSSKQKKKQIYNANNILKYLKTDRTDNLYNLKGDFRRINLLSSEVNHVKKINEIVHLAIKEGQAYSQIENGLHYIATTKFDSHIMANINNKRKGQLVAHILDATNKMSAYYPIILSLNDPNALYRFFMDELHIIVVVDMGIIEQLLDEYKLNIKFSMEDPTFFAAITNPNIGLDEEFHSIRVSHLFWSRLYYEFLSLDWFVKEIAHWFNK
jgi:hypothetical protein